MLTGNIIGVSYAVGIKTITTSGYQDLFTIRNLTCYQRGDSKVHYVTICSFTNSFYSNTSTYLLS